MSAYQTTSGINLIIAVAASASVDIWNIRVMHFESST